MEAAPIATDPSWLVHARRVQWAWAFVLVILVTLGAFLLQARWSRAEELPFVVKALVYAGVALVSHHALLLAGVNLGLAALLFVAVRGETKWPVLAQLALLVNRQARHVETLAPWLVFAAVAFDWLPAQAAAMSAVLVLGPIFVDRNTLPRTPDDKSSGPGKGNVALTAAMLLGGLLVVLTDRTQWKGAAGFLLPLVAGSVPRTLWAVWWAPSSTPESRKGLSAARRFGSAIGLAERMALVAAPLIAMGGGLKASRLDKAARISPWMRCDPRPSAAPALRMFLVADTQFHALEGKRSGLHLDVVDSVVPVAVRPIELDLLEGATLQRFAAIHAALGGEVPWIHLGDMADLGCRSELDRFRALLPAFVRPPLALALGNHDSTFLGNLAWHPDWTAACAGHRSDRGFALAFIDGVDLAPGTVVSRNERFRAAVAAIGNLEGRPVQAIVFDTTDDGGDGLGIAGVQGGISERQRSWIEKSAAPDAFLIAFGHHPLDELSRKSRDRVTSLATRWGDRLLALISAHTHVAAERGPLPRDSRLRELIVGSTIDPPQEAAVLEVWPDGPTVRIVTVPAVAREGSTCGDFAGAVTHTSCEQAISELKSRPGCANLFAPAAAGPSRTPEQLERSQNDRARRLLDCIAPDRFPGQSPLHSYPDLGASLDRLYAAGGESPVKRDLVCLSWAASIAQGHKADGWTMEQALRFAFSPSAAYAAIAVRLKGGKSP